jgi:hypothetical protein
VLGLAATKPWRIVVKIDVKGAFVQMPMMGGPTFVRYDPKIMRYAVNLNPEFGNLVEDDGCLYMELLKSLYGCVQASALWYALIRQFLDNLGYEVCLTNQCIFV